jgi:transcription elongation factor GreA
MAQPSYLSREGLEKLQSELEHLRTVSRHDAAERIQQSRERGGTVGSAEYQEAKNELAFVEGRILTLDSMINNAVIIEEGQGGGDIVEVGNMIAVKDQSGRAIKYRIVGSAEAAPSKGRISNVSPIGHGLLGKRVGEITEVDVPSGKIRLEVMAIE